ncbi:MAG: ethanolamine ammonia-lyase reactivating factor EutA, partial [Deltaproteobacteria bacterium]|nr:ethanolamine ammonia-lyase reactivating factor EutA [Deltaproteobacteria bacterium]
MPDRITVLGIDIGSTTSHCILVEASIAADGIERTRNRVVDPKILYQSEVTFTPFQNETIDTAALSHLLDTWLPNRQVPFREVTNVGAIITGLAAVSRNRVAIIEELRRRFPKASVITAEDPRLESWVAWHGAAGPLSLGRPGQPILNFDIGGGTTNLALGVDGRVLATGSYFIGARHFLVDKGQLIPRSHSARAILSARPELAALPAADTAQALARLYTGLLENLLTDAQSPILSQFEQAAFPATDLSSCTITFSGGVGELIYANSDPPLFSFGDIGGHLARAIRSS